MSTVAAEFKTTKQLILYILEHYPETRNSDNKLFIQCVKHLGARTLDDLGKINLNMISVHKLRQRIQNVEKLFPPTNKVKEVRSERQREIKKYMRDN